MRILVTGANGFVGRHVLRELTQHGHDPLTFVYDAPDFDVPEAGRSIEVDITDANAVGEAIASWKPDACIHLAGIAFVPKGTSDPTMMFAVNVTGTTNVLDSFRQHCPAARILVISSSQVYGSEPRENAAKEADALMPSSHYAVSKASADLMTLTYARSYQMHAMTARPHNHTGPGQSPDFVVPAFARQLKEMSAGRAEPCLKVGNLDSERDFMDIRDVARAYRLLIEKGRGGEAYNMGSGNAVKIRSILETLCDIAGVTPDIQVDPARYREADGCVLLDTAKIEQDTGWRTEIELVDTLKDLFDSI